MLLQFTDQSKPIERLDLLHITSGIHQTTDGDVHAFDASITAHWILIRVGEESGLSIETNDPKIEERLNTHFQVVEEMDALDR